MSTPPSYVREVRSLESATGARALVDQLLGALLDDGGDGFEDVESLAGRGGPSSLGRTGELDGAAGRQAADLTTYRTPRTGSR